MRRILLLAAALAVALPTAAEAAVLPSVNAGTLTVIGDGAADTHHAAPHLAHARVDVNGMSTSTARRSRRSTIRSGAGDDTVQIDGRADRADDDRDRRGRRHRDRRARRRADLDRRRRRPGRARRRRRHRSSSARATTPRFQGDGFDSVDGQSGQGPAAAPPGRPTPRSSRCRPSTARRGSRATRGPSTTDSTAVETLDVNAAGGQDLIDIGDLDRPAVLDVERRPRPAGRRARPDPRPGHRRVQQHQRAPVPRHRARRGPGPDDPDRERAARPTTALTVFGRGGVDFISADRTSASGSR